MIKTVTLSGIEVEIAGLGGFNTIVHNLSDEAVYASKYPNIKAGADNVAEIPAGVAKLISTTNGTVYVLGTGKIELTGQDYEGLNCSSSSPSGVISGTSDVTKAYVDMQDASARSYADNAVNASKKSLEQKLSETSDKISANTEDITALRSEKADRSELSETVNSANAYTDKQLGDINSSMTALQTDKADKSDLSETLSSANAYTDEQLGEINSSVTALQTEKADKSELSETLSSANAYTDEQFGTLNSGIADLKKNKADKSEMIAVSNPNLLDNWCFAAPINQRRGTEYAFTDTNANSTSSDQCIDRWRINRNNTKLEFGTDSITLSNSAGKEKSFFQYVDKITKKGTTITASVLVKNVVGSTALRLEYNNASYRSSSKTADAAGVECYTITHTVTDDVTKYITFALSIPERMQVIAAKLEIGDRQTLAFLDKDGKWALYDRFDRESELMKCQCYLAQLVSSHYPTEGVIGVGIVTTSTSALSYVTVPSVAISRSLKRSPTTVSRSGSWKVKKQNSTFNVTSISLKNLTAGSATLMAKIEGELALGDICLLMYDSPASGQINSLIINADL